MLRAIGVTKRYGTNIGVDRLDLQVDPGEVLCLLGANGAGKTTTVRLFLGFTLADEGSVEVDGVDPSRNPVRARRAVAYIPENVMLYDELTGLENLVLFDRMSGGARSDEDYLGILAAQGLELGRAKERVAGYSKGMRQKVALGIAAAREAKALLLDEPMSGLDPSAANEFARAILAERDRGAAVLLTTHDIFRAKSMLRASASCAREFCPKCSTRRRSTPTRSSESTCTTCRWIPGRRRHDPLGFPTRVDSAAALSSALRPARLHGVGPGRHDLVVGVDRHVTERLTGRGS